MQRNRLINRPQLVKSICPQPTDTQAQVDLRKRWNGYWHGRIDLITNHVAGTLLPSGPVRHSGLHLPQTSHCGKVFEPLGGPNLLSRTNGTALMLGLALGIGVLAFRLPPIPQPASYHQFADQRPWLGIPNFGDVASNLAFAVVGLAGLWFLLKPEKLTNAFVDHRERRPYLVAFFGLLLTAFGSAYYHLAPSNARLVWDRLPMTIVFGALVAVVIIEHISAEAGLKLLPFLVAIAGGSVLQWIATSYMVTVTCARTQPCSFTQHSYC
jgi:hypothetical protein